jgi:hypothetical protein
MRMLSILANFRLVALLVVALAASGSPSIAVDHLSRAADRICLWRGTAPFCKGACEAGEVLFATAASQEGAQPNELGFGKSCASGRKFYCCMLQCPEGWALSANDCVQPCPEGWVVSDNRCVPREPSAETMSKGPVAVPAPYETYEQVPVPKVEEPYAPKRDHGPMTKD